MQSANRVERDGWAAGEGGNGGGGGGGGDGGGGSAEGWCATVGEDHEINMYVGGCGPRGSGVASNPRQLIGQRPP